MYINRLLNGCGCDMVFIASGCLISRTSERSEQVSDIIQPHCYYMLIYTQRNKLRKKLSNLSITHGSCVYERLKSLS